MEISLQEKSFSLSRKAASGLLGVSTRTLDRYIKAGKLSTRIVNGRIWLDKEQAGAFKSGRDRVYSPDIVNMSTVKSSVDGDRINSDTVNSFDDNDDKISKVLPLKGQSPFKKLYKEIRDELREKQERLEVANYRVGQLEAQLRNCIPMLEYHKENYERKRNEEGLKDKLGEASQVIKKLSAKCRQQKLVKRVFLATLITVLALQPLWLLIYLNNVL
jgi:hypothetical protein